MNLNRRSFLRACGLGSVAATVGISAWAAEDPLPDDDAQFASFDAEIEEFMRSRKVPGGSLAVVKDNRLVYAKGYGWADREKQIPVEPKSLFRIASVSKPITSVAVMKLVEQGKLNLEDRAFDFLSLKPLPKAKRAPDPRLGEITIRQLLHHTGGWDRDKSFDAMFRSREFAKAAGTPSPANAETVIRCMLSQPLDFAPGTRYAYSNFGFCVLGRIIEKITGKGYEQHLKEAILGPMGIQRMRIGASLPEGRAPDEVKYYLSDNDKGRSVFASVPGKVPWPYGGFCLEAMDAHGGWIASAVDLARFAAALYPLDENKVLNASTTKLMYEPPAPPVSRKPDGSLNNSFYGCGWSVRPIAIKGKANYWHSGSLPGTATLLVRRWDGVSWAVLFNQRSENSKLPDGAIDSAMHRAAAKVMRWPERNLFDRFA